jgi:small subunit ribosomal protein S6
MEENNTSAELKNQKFKYFHKFYELGLWLSIDSEVDKELERIKKLLTSYGAEIFFVDSFNKRKMAYPVKKQTMGYFGYLLFKLDNGENILEIKNNLRKINSILRFIIIKRKYLFSKEFNNKKEEVIKK